MNDNEDINIERFKPTKLKKPRETLSWYYIHYLEERIKELELDYSILKDSMKELEEELKQKWCDEK